MLKWTPLVHLSVSIGKGFRSEGCDGKTAGTVGSCCRKPCHGIAVSPGEMLIEEMLISKQEKVYVSVGRS